MPSNEIRKSPTGCWAFSFLINEFLYYLRAVQSKDLFQNLQTTKNPINQIFMRFNDGAGTRIRTVDLLITSQLLYQLSYAGDVE